MGLRARKIYALSLLSVIAAVLAAGTFLHAQDVTSGSYTVLKRYIFPRYNDDNEIQYVIYGATAVNKGSLIYLTTPMIDIVDGAYTSIRQIDTIDTKDPYPEPYELSAEIMELREFWTKTHHRHSQAWIFAEKATFDKTTNILTSDEEAHFRSRQLDADGLGFEAFNDRKFVHIRSQVHAVVHFKDDKDSKSTENNEQGLGSLFSSKKPAEVHADSADIDLGNNIITLIGNVTVDDQTNIIKCDRMMINLADDASDSLIGSAERPAGANDRKTAEKAPDTDAFADDDAEDDADHSSIRKIIFIGNVACAMKDGSGGEEKLQIALCDKAEYDVLTNVIVMTGALRSAPADVLREYGKNDPRFLNIEEAVAAVYGIMERQISRNILARSPMMIQQGDWMIGKTFTIYAKDNNRLKVEEIKANYKGALVSTQDEETTESASGGSEAGDEETNTLISADNADIDIEHDSIVLSGNVDVSDPSSKVTCHEMEILLNGDKEQSSAAVSPEEAGMQDSGKQDENLFGNKSVSKVICKNDVVFVELPSSDDPNGTKRIAMSDLAEYDTLKGNLLMTGNSVVMQGGNRLHGNRIRIFPQENNRMSVDRAKAEIPVGLLSSDGEESPSGLEMTTITADSADIRPNDKITLAGNVVVVDKSSGINCGKMDIYLQKGSSNSLFGATKPKGSATTADRGIDRDDNGISKIVCTKDFEYRKIEKDGKVQIATADHAEYDPVRKTIRLTEKPVVIQDLDRVSGDEIEVLLAQEGQDEIRIHFAGNVVYMDRNPETDTYGENRIALSDEALYSGETGILEMSGSHSDIKGVLSENVYESALQCFLHIMDENDAYSPERWNTYDKNKKRRIGENRLGELYAIVVNGAGKEGIFLGNPVKVFTKEKDHFEVTYPVSRLSSHTQGLFSAFTSDMGADGNAESPADIAATTAKYQNNTLHLRDNVVVDNGSYKISCETMTIDLVDGTKDPSGNEKTGTVDDSPAALPAIEKEGHAAGEKERDGRNDFLGGDKDVSSALCTGNFTFLIRAENDDPQRIVLSRRAEYHSEDRQIRAYNSDVNFTERDNGLSVLSANKKDILSQEEFVSSNMSSRAYDEIVQTIMKDFNQRKSLPPPNWQRWSDEQKREFCKATIEQNVLGILGSEWVLATEIFVPIDRITDIKLNGVRHKGAFKDWSKR